MSSGLCDLLFKGFNVNVERISCICNGIDVSAIWQNYRDQRIVSCFNV